MEDKTLLWSRRTACGIALLFLVLALIPTVTVGLVYLNGERIHLFRIERQNTFSVEFDLPERFAYFARHHVLIKFNYIVEGQTYHAQTYADPLTEDLGDGDGSFIIRGWHPQLDILVWKLLPSYPIVLAPGAHPLSKTIPYWLMAALGVLVYCWLGRLATSKSRTKSVDGTP